jgi:TRAP-type mannitol/chloroaromatic compound transport system permease small subunit
MTPHNRRRNRETGLQGLLAFARAADGLSRWTGIIAAWFVLLASLVSAFNAIFRYSINSIVWLGQHYPVLTGPAEALFDLYRDNSNTMRDMQLIMFAGMVMLGAAWTLKVNEHVRVDLVYSTLDPRRKAWIDLLGCVLFLIPFCVVMIWLSWPWFWTSWVTDEMSINAGGLPRWPFKLFLPLGFALLLLQGLSELVKCIATLAIGYDRGHKYEKPVQ